MLHLLLSALRPFASVRFPSTKEVGAPTAVVVPGERGTGLTLGQFHAARAAAARWDAQRDLALVAPGMYRRGDKVIEVLCCGLLESGELAVVTHDPVADRIVVYNGTTNPVWTRA